jgi:O-methyltransferase involved in polyketide biosynthesis
VSHGPPHLSPQEMAAALHGVPSTLVISLLARHLASSRPDPIISDPAASALISRLGLSHLDGDWSFCAVETAAAVRTGILDAAVRSFADGSRHPTVITVGAGLCTRCIRLGDLDADWIDIDLPEVAALRSALLPPAPNRTVLGESALGRGWRARVAAIDGPRLFVIEGLTMYLDEPAVRDLVTGLADRCPGSHLLIETTGPPAPPPGRYRQLDRTPHAGTRFRWGVRRLSELTSWHPRLELVQTWHLMDYHCAAWPAPVRVLRRLPSVRTQSKIGHFHVTTERTAAPVPAGFPGPGKTRLPKQT